MTQTNDQSVLASLRALTPQRPLRFGEALQIAEQQATRLLELADVTGPPVASGIISDLPRIEVILRTRMPIAGSAHWAQGRWVVCLARSDHPRRRRFSLAHEFKHVLDHPYRSFVHSGFRPDQVERTADAFAAALLMPKRFVREAFTSGIQDTHELARLFDVSPAAMRVRLRQLGFGSVSAGCGTTWRRSSKFTPYRHQGARR